MHVVVLVAGITCRERSRHISIIHEIIYSSAGASINKRGNLPDIHTVDMHRELIISHNIEYSTVQLIYINTPRPL